MSRIYVGFLIVFLCAFYAPKILEAKAIALLPNHCQLQNLFNKEGLPKRQIIYFRGYGKVEEATLKLLRSIVEVGTLGQIHLDGSTSLVTGSFIEMENTNWNYFSQDEWTDHGISEAVECTRQLLKSARVPTENGYLVPNILAGFSNGGRAAVEYAERLRKKGLRIPLAITVDPVPKGVEMIPATFSIGALDSLFLYKVKNVDRWINLLQRDNLPRGGNVKNADVTLIFRGVNGHYGLPKSPLAQATVRSEILKIPPFRLQPK